MKNFIFIVLNLVALDSFAKITFENLKDSQWFSGSEDHRDYVINGTVDSKVAPAEIRVKIKDKITSAPIKNGKFKVPFDEYNLYYDNFTDLEISAYNKNDLVESRSVRVYCCTTDDFGPVLKLIPNVATAIKINKKSSEYDGIEMLIPAGIQKEPGELLVMVLQDEGSLLPLNKMLPLSRVFKMRLLGYSYSSVSNQNIKVKIPFVLKQPRDELGHIVNVYSWNSSSKKEWEDINFKKLKIGAYYFDIDKREWLRLPISKVKNNTVEFEIPYIEFGANFMIAGEF